MGLEGEAEDEAEEEVEGEEEEEEKRYDASAGGAAPPGICS